MCVCVCVCVLAASWTLWSAMPCGIACGSSQLHWLLITAHPCSIEKSRTRATSWGSWSWWLSIASLPTPRLFLGKSKWALSNGDLWHLSSIFHTCLKLSSFCDENPLHKRTPQAITSCWEWPEAPIWEPHSDFSILSFGLFPSFIVFKFCVDVRHPPLKVVVLECRGLKGEFFFRTQNS